MACNIGREHSPSGHGGNKLRSYRLFKNEFHLEPYLLNIQSIALRVAMTRLRVRCHSLEIEVGKYHKPRPPPLSERHCYTCKDVEDEKHFMCVSTRYEKLRSELEEKIKCYYRGFTWLSTEQRFVFMMAPTHKVYRMQLHITYPYSGLFSWVQIFVKCWRWPSELIFVVLKFVANDARISLSAVRRARVHVMNSDRVRVDV